VGNSHLANPPTFAAAADLSCRSASEGSITKSVSARINGYALVLGDGGSKRCSNDGWLNNIVRIVDANTTINELKETWSPFVKLHQLCRDAIHRIEARR